jgi:hypothetical protein
MGNLIRVKSHLFYQLSCPLVVSGVDGVVQNELSAPRVGVLLDGDGYGGADDEAVAIELEDQESTLLKIEGLADVGRDHHRAALTEMDC